LHPILSFLHNFSVGRDAKLFSSDAFLSLTITHMPPRVRTIIQNRIRPIFFRLTKCQKWLFSVECSCKVTKFTPSKPLYVICA
jgi:hypothetical protein